MSQAEEDQAGQSNTEPRERCYCMGAGPALSRFASLFEPPGEAGEHFRQARIEMLRGIRALIDHRIETLSRAAAKGTRVPVE